VREGFDTLAQGQHAVQAVEHFIERAGAPRRVFVIAMDVDEGQACDLAGTFVDGLLDAVLGLGDLAFEAHAAVGSGFEMLEPVWGCEVFEQAGDEEARDFPELGHGVQREEDAQEGQQELEHGRSMMPAPGPVESGRLYPPMFEGQVVEIRRDVSWPSYESGAPPSPNLSFLAVSFSGLSRESWLPAAGEFVVGPFGSRTEILGTSPRMTPVRALFFAGTNPGPRRSVHRKVRFPWRA
jgi:hypothetical protein